MLLIYVLLCLCMCAHDGQCGWWCMVLAMILTYKSHHYPFFSGKNAVWMVSLLSLWKCCYNKHQKPVLEHACVYFGILISTVALTNMSMSGGLLIAFSIPTSYMHHWLCLCIQILCQHFCFQIAVFVHYASIFVVVVIVWLVYCCVQPMQETVLLMEDILIDYITDTVCALVFFSCWNMSSFLFSCWYISAECQAFVPLPNWICASGDTETFVPIGGSGLHLCSCLVSFHSSMNVFAK
jgi:hypothetical protein